jgi:elongation factor Tu
MPQFRTAIMNARAQGVSRVVVHLENTSVLNDGELLELVVLETKELLKSFNYTSRNSEIVQCARSC